MVEGSLVAKKRRYSREPDLEVVVEDEVFRVHSRDLMAASDVFANMLESDMRESEEGRIVLQGKSKEDFRVLLQHVTRAGATPFPDITDENVFTLLQWADEYQIDGLTARCEEHLLESSGTDVVTMLKVGVQYKLKELKERCAEVVARNVFDYRNDLSPLVGDACVMKSVLPALFKAAGLNEPSELPFDSLEVKHLWPLAIRAIEAMKGWKSLEDNQAYARHAQSVTECVFKSIPQQDSYQTRPKGLNMAELKKIHAERCSEEMIQRLVERMKENGCIERTSGGRYYKSFLRRGTQPSMV